MIYRIKEGDTLYTIANRLTLSPEYADPLAFHNGIFADDGESPYYRHAPLPLPLGTIEIPDNWLNPSATIIPVSPGSIWLYVGALLLGALWVARGK